MTPGHINFAIHSLFDHIHRYMKPVPRGTQTIVKSSRSIAPVIQDIPIHPISLDEARQADLVYKPGMVEWNDRNPSSSYPRNRPSKPSKSRRLSNNKNYRQQNISAFYQSKTSWDNENPERLPFQDLQRMKALTANDDSYRSILKKSPKKKFSHSVKIVAAPATIQSTFEPAKKFPALPSSPPAQPALKSARRLRRKSHISRQVEDQTVLMPEDKHEKKINEVLELRKNLENMLEEFYKLKDDRENIARDLVVLRGMLNNLNQNLDTSFNKLNMSKSFERKGKKSVRRPSRGGAPDQPGNTQRNISFDRSLLD